MGNSISDSSITVLCNCQNELTSSTPGDIYHQRIRCCACNISIPHAGIMFHCPNSNKFNHKYRYDLCTSCSIQNALKVSCKHCDKSKMQKIHINNKHKNLQCNQCNEQIKFISNQQYLYKCKMCDRCIICAVCAKNPSIMAYKQQQYINKLNNLNTHINDNIQHVMTTLHRYPMSGPYTPETNMVWYCDNPKCESTNYGEYLNYKMQKWRSSVLGKKFVLCDECVKQHEKEQSIIVLQPQFNVELKMNQNNRTESEFIQNQQEGIVETNNNKINDMSRNIAFTVTAKLKEGKPIDEWWFT